MIVDVNICANCINCAGVACLANNKTVYEMKGKDCGFFEKDQDYYEEDK